MATRFETQDEILDNLSQSIKIFQDTMKIVGETVCWDLFALLINLIMTDKVK